MQAPYRWHIRSLDLGRTLDVGCGIGRNMAHLGRDAVGVDHNAAAVEMARSRGLTAWTVAEWPTSPDARPASYDSMLLAHVLEHMTGPEGVALIRSYLGYLRPGGRIVLITPQERGWATDPTHVRFVGFADLQAVCDELDCAVELRRSFPFPRPVGRVFAHNEFVVVGRRR